jgi:hypothetical protein
MGVIRGRVMGPRSVPLLGVGGGNRTRCLVLGTDASLADHTHVNSVPGRNRTSEGQDQQIYSLPSLPLEYRHVNGWHGRSRTHTDLVNSQAPLPIGLRAIEWRRPPRS